MRRYIEVPLQLLDIEGEGFHIMVKGLIHGKEAHFLIDTGASRSVFDPKTIANFIDHPEFEKKQGMTAGVGSSDIESSTFMIDSLSIGDMEIHDYEAVALDLENIHEMYAKLGLPRIDGIIGGDLLRRHRAIINYKAKKIRLNQ
ncbi:MAG: clan AA aspartic protease [Bacteroidales bacterium]|nr:clan AA aspartic protease [Bacteroidales bacterium]